MELVENALVNKRWTMVRAQARAIIFMSKFQVYKFVLHPAQVSDPEKMSRLAARNQQALDNGHRSKCSALNRVNGTITAHIADTAKSMQTAVANRTKSEQHTHDAEKKTASVEKMAANKAAAHAHILQLEQHKEAGGAVNKNGDGHLHHYTLEAQETREAIRHLPHVEDILTHWWHACHAHFDDGDQTLSKDEYRVFYDRLVSAFSEHEEDGDVDIDDPEVLEAAFEEDWERDSHGDGNIDKDEFKDSIFEMADMWCETTEEEEYVEYLEHMFVRVFGEYASKDAAIAQLMKRLQQPTVGAVQDSKALCEAGALSGSFPDESDDAILQSLLNNADVTASPGQAVHNMLNDVADSVENSQKAADGAAQSANLAALGGAGAAGATGGAASTISSLAIPQVIHKSSRPLTHGRSPRWSTSPCRLAPLVQTSTGCFELDTSAQIKEVPQNALRGTTNVVREGDSWTAVDLLPGDPIGDGSDTSDGSDLSDGSTSSDRSDGHYDSDGVWDAGNGSSAHGADMGSDVLQAGTHTAEHLAKMAKKKRRAWRRRRRTKRQVAQDDELGYSDRVQSKPSTSDDRVQSKSQHAGGPSAAGLSSLDKADSVLVRMPTGGLMTEGQCSRAVQLGQHGSGGRSGLPDGNGGSNASGGSNTSGGGSNGCGGSSGCGASNASGASNTSGASSNGCGGGNGSDGSHGSVDMDGSGGSHLRAHTTGDLRSGSADSSPAHWKAGCIVVMGDPPEYFLVLADDDAAAGSTLENSHADGSDGGEYSAVPPDDSSSSARSSVSSNESGYDSGVEPPPRLSHLPDLSHLTEEETSKYQQHLKRYGVSVETQIDMNLMLNVELTTCLLQRKDSGLERKRMMDMIAAKEMQNADRKRVEDEKQERDEKTAAELRARFSKQQRERQQASAKAMRSAQAEMAVESMRMKTLHEQAMAEADALAAEAGKRVLAFAMAQMEPQLAATLSKMKPEVQGAFLRGFDWYARAGEAQAFTDQLAKVEERRVMWETDHDLELAEIQRQHALVREDSPHQVFDDIPEGVAYHNEDGDDVSSGTGTSQIFRTTEPAGNEVDPAPSGAAGGARSSNDDEASASSTESPVVIRRGSLLAVAAGVNPDCDRWNSCGIAGTAAAYPTDSDDGNALKDHSVISSSSEQKTQSYYPKVGRKNTEQEKQLPSEQMQMKQIIGFNAHKRHFGQAQNLQQPKKVQTQEDELSVHFSISTGTPEAIFIQLPPLAQWLYTLLLPEERATMLQLGGPQMEQMLDLFEPTCTPFHFAYEEGEVRLLVWLRAGEVATASDGDGLLSMVNMRVSKAAQAYLLLPASFRRIPVEPLRDVLRRFQLGDSVVSTALSGEPARSDWWNGGEGAEGSMHSHARAPTYERTTARSREAGAIDGAQLAKHSQVEHGHARELDTELGLERPWEGVEPKLRLDEALAGFSQLSPRTQSTLWEAGESHREQLELSAVREEDRPDGLWSSSSRPTLEQETELSVAQRWRMHARTSPLPATTHPRRGRASAEQQLLQHLDETRRLAYVEQDTSGTIGLQPVDLCYSATGGGGANSPQPHSPDSIDATVAALSDPRLTRTAPAAGAFKRSLLLKSRAMPAVQTHGSAGSGATSPQFSISMSPVKGRTDSGVFDGGGEISAGLGSTMGSTRFLRSSLGSATSASTPTARPQSLAAFPLTQGGLPPASKNASLDSLLDGVRGGVHQHGSTASEMAEVVKAKHLPATVHSTGKLAGSGTHSREVATILVGASKRVGLQQRYARPNTPSSIQKELMYRQMQGDRAKEQLRSWTRSRVGRLEEKPRPPGPYLQRKERSKAPPPPQPEAAAPESLQTVTHFRGRPTDIQADIAERRRSAQQRRLSKYEDAWGDEYLAWVAEHNSSGIASKSGGSPAPASVAPINLGGMSANSTSRPARHGERAGQSGHAGEGSTGSGPVMSPVVGSVLQSRADKHTRTRISKMPKAAGPWAEAAAAGAAVGASDKRVVRGQSGYASTTAQLRERRKGYGYGHSTGGSARFEKVPVIPKHVHSVSRLDHNGSKLGALSFRSGLSGKSF
jgi:hypothetical protein